MLNIEIKERIKNSGRVTLSDGYIEILSGTTKQGNSLKAPISAIAKYGVIPAKYLPLEEGVDWDTYMSPSRVTQVHKDLGQQFLRRIQINYEQVPLEQFPHALSIDLLSVAGHGWPAPVGGIYPKTDGEFNHAFANVNPFIDALDNYNPFVKRLAKDFIFFQWGYSLSIVSQNPYPNETIALFEVLQKSGLLAFFVEALSRLISK